jgi:hypothetical protein
MKIPVVLLIALVAGLLGFAVGRSTGDGKDSDSTVSTEQLAEKLQQANLKVEELSALVTTREGQIRKLEAEVASAAVSEAPFDGPTRLAPTPAEPEEEGTSPPFFADRFDGAVRKLDWTVIGTNVSEMAKLIPEIIAYVAEGKSPPMDKATRIGQLNRPVLMEALKLGEEVPGTGVNGKFTNPAFILNTLAATLEQFKLPLSDAQQERLSALAEIHFREDRQRLAGYDDQTWELTKLLEEVELKSRFFDGCFEVLTAEQTEELVSPLVKNRIRADLFSEALVYAGRVDVFPFTDQTDLTAKVHGRIARLLTGADETLGERSLAPVTRWVQQLPTKELYAEANALDREGMITSDRATKWGHQVVGLLKSLVTELSLSPETAAGLRGLAGLAVPLSTPD